MGDDDSIVANSALGYAESVIDLEHRVVGNTIYWTHKPRLVAIAFFIFAGINIAAMIALPVVVPGPGIDLVLAVIVLAGCIPGLWLAFRGARMWQWKEELRIDLANGLAVYVWARSERDTVTLEAPIEDLVIAITEVRHSNGYKQVGVIAQVPGSPFCHLSRPVRSEST